MLTLIKRPRTSLRNGKKPRQWKFGHLKLVLHCNTCCANTTKYALASSTLKTRNGLAKSEPRPVAKACGGLQELRHRDHQRRFAGLIHAAEPASEKCWFDCFSSMPLYSLICIGWRQRGQGSPIARDDDIRAGFASVCGSNRDDYTNARN